MKKIFILSISLILLTGCAETMALLGPASSAFSGGNVVHSSISSVASYGVKKTTGKSPMEHAVAYVEDKNPNKEKDRCISFLKKTESEACYIAKKQISSVKKSTIKKIKNTITSPKIKIVKKIKTEQNPPAHTEGKKAIVKIIKKKNELQLKSVESMLLKSAFNKKQISHLRVSIKKNSTIKD